MDSRCMTTTMVGYYIKKEGLSSCEYNYIIYLWGNSIHTLGNPYSIYLQLQPHLQTEIIGKWIGKYELKICHEENSIKKWKNEEGEYIGKASPFRIVKSYFERKIDSIFKQLWWQRQRENHFLSR